MKKIVIPFEGISYRAELLGFVRDLNTRSRVMLTAAFVPQADYAQLWNISVPLQTNVYLPDAPDEDKVIARNSRRVKNFCQDHDIQYCVHEDRFDFAIGAIRKESRFADLLLLSSCHFFEVIDDNQPNAYLREILHGAECPVLLLPEKPALPGEIVLAYDGSASSVSAIRQFAATFPEFCKLKTTLVYIGADLEESGIPDDTLIRELCEQHFRNFRMLHLRMRTESFYDTWIGMMQNPWLVSGAFGRSGLSRLFHHSFLDRLIHTHKVPLFVAHH